MGHKIIFQYSPQFKVEANISQLRRSKGNLPQNQFKEREAQSVPNVFPPSVLSSVQLFPLCILHRGEEARKQAV